MSMVHKLTFGKCLNAFTHGWMDGKKTIACIHAPYLFQRGYNIKLGKHLKFCGNPFQDALVHMKPVVGGGGGE